MLYEDLHRFYGSHIARRVEAELSDSEFSHVTVGELPRYLDMRAKEARKEYQARLVNPFLDEDKGDERAEFVDGLCRTWREAESLAYLVSAAEDVNAVRVAS